MQPRGCIWICRAEPFAPTPQCCVPVCCPMLVFGVSCFCVQDVIKWWNCFWTPSGIVCDKRVWLCEVLKTASEQSRNKNECSHKNTQENTGRGLICKNTDLINSEIHWVVHHRVGAGAYLLQAIHWFQPFHRIPKQTGSLLNDLPVANTWSTKVF